MAQLTNAFSKKWGIGRPLTLLACPRTTFARLHKKLRFTLKMDARITDYIWTIAELICLGKLSLCDLLD